MEADKADFFLEILTLAPGTLSFSRDMVDFLLFGLITLNFSLPFLKLFIIRYFKIKFVDVTYN